MVSFLPRCRVIHGTRGLKHRIRGAAVVVVCRVLHGTRGLKLQVFDSTLRISRSRPSRDAWIETVRGQLLGHLQAVASFTGRVD